MKKFVLALVLLAFPASAEDVWRLGTSQHLAFTSTSRPVTTAFDASTNMVRVVCTTACFLAFRESNAYNAVTAYSNGATSAYVPAGIPEYFIVPGSGRAAAIAVSTDGTLHITEVSK